MTDKNKSMAPQKSFDKKCESTFYCPQDETLYLKYEDKLSIYKKISVAQNGESQAWFEASKPIKLPPKQLNNYAILKVYNKHVYFINTLDNMTVKIMDIDNGGKILAILLKLLAKALP